MLAFCRALLTRLPRPQALELIPPFVNKWMDRQFNRWIARQVYANRTLPVRYRRLYVVHVSRAAWLSF